MELVENWQEIIKKAWSFRLAALAVVLSGCEVLLPMLIDSMPRGLFALLSGLITTGAMAARVVLQKNLHPEATYYEEV